MSSRRIGLSTAVARMSCAILAARRGSEVPIPATRRRRRRRPRLLALVAFRDEMRFLPGLYENLATQVDGVVALDDGSTDGSGDYAAAQPLTVQLISVPSGVQGELEDGLNQRSLIQAATGTTPTGCSGSTPTSGWSAGSASVRSRSSRAPTPRGSPRSGSRGASSGTRRTSGAATGSGAASGRAACSDPTRRTRSTRSASIPSGPARATRAAGSGADLRLYHLRMIDPADRMPRVERYRPDRSRSHTAGDRLRLHARRRRSPALPDRARA